ncbi:kynurenine formamidase [Bacilli bacterium PM5-3]|nr:kynurenine formamidase [Bacilli bacterium PM5-3]MDH6603537.1 kynurenine formamidase [Bacilli bacterium PM5-9]
MKNLYEIVDYLRTKEWVDLTHNVNPEIPRFGAFEPIKEKVLYTKEEAGFFVKEYTVTGQYGTHVDAPVHFSYKYSRDIAQVEIKEMIAPMYVLHLEDEVEKNHDFAVQVEHILEFEKEYGKIEEGAFVAFSSNWSKRWHDPESFYNFDEDGNAHTPGWSKEAVEFLAQERKVVAIGHESLDTDSAEGGRKAGFFEAENAILDHDHYQIEVMTNLDKVPPVGAIIVNSWPKIDGSPGFPSRSFAILP